MIACHHATPGHVDWSTRSVCELIGRILDSQIAFRADNAALQLRMASRKMHYRFEVGLYATQSLVYADHFDCPRLLELFDADGLVLQIDGVVSYHGCTVDSEALLPVVNQLRERSWGGVARSHMLSSIDPSAAAYASQVSGALYLDLSEGSGDYLLMLRRELVQTVNWAGNPDKSVVTGAQGQLHPRASFQDWREILHGRSRPWTELELESARFAREQLIRQRTALFAIAARKDAEQMLHDQLLMQHAQAEEANRAKSAFLSAVSHEIRTPMNAILGIAELLWESQLDASQRRYVEVFRQAGGNLLALVNNLLDLSKIESGRFQLEQIDFDIEELVERTFEMIWPKARAKRLVLISRFEPGMPLALIGDSVRLQQILINLLMNAVKFTESGEIILEVWPDLFDPGRLHFEVTDTGIGIPADKLDTIFEDFAQAEASTARRFGGTGLGLGICRRLVSRMGGQLTVRSVLGKGSTFCFDAVFEKSAQDKVRHPELVSALVGRRVLIVDESPANRMIFAEMFRAWGMEASECASAGAALPALELTPRNQKEFDLIILHRIMPEVKGFDLVAQIHETSPNLPILITMSENIPADRIRDHQLGIAGYILKPVRRDELLRLVCNVLGAPASVQEQEERTAILNSARQDSAATRAFKILVAEDSDDNRFLVQEYLKNQPYQITFVENGEEAVMMARAQPFDLILMDILMPVMDGLTAAKLIRKAEQEDGRDCVPVVALTANAHQQDIEASRAAGCDSHLTKPISKETLLRAIAEYSRRQPAEAPVLPGSLSIDVPPGLEAAAKHYIAARKAEVPRLMNLAAGHDFDQLRVLAHNVKGTGTSYGFPELTRLAKLIESSAKERNESALPAQLLELSEYVQKAEQAVSALPSPRSA